MSPAARSPFRRVGLVLAHPWARISTAPQMTAQYLASQGYEVDVFVDQNADMEGMGINLPEMPHPRALLRVCPQGGEAPPATLDDGTPLPREHWRFVERYGAEENRYDWLIGFDPGGLTRAAALAERWRIPFVYHSLEIDDADHPNKPLERRLTAAALFSLSQDRLRADLLARLNQVDPASVHVSINSTIGPVLPEHKRYFHERFPIGNRRVVLAIGTLLPFGGIRGFIETKPLWPEEYALVFHGWLPDPDFKRYVEDAVRGNDSMFLSTGIVALDEKFDLFQSADVGLVFFEPSDVNHANAGASAGKFFDFMRCGVPCVGDDKPGMRELLTDQKLGVAIKDYAQLPGALANISARRDELRERCLELFPSFEFSRVYEPILAMTEARVFGAVMSGAAA
ncbi:MAG: glycosyltransferase [Humidesulfovibrio sp.]|uniref:glycosyltransferase n=1 Tax=Humidesulfovibrio sp. TaxID=2910988 RepID=UPI0027EAC074|nr:glycosyltransferase [Humidesulfovibrio sp.]MDQ7834338.1 glycosyltransferase [Humidesulfovibrio sp.]